MLFGVYFLAKLILLKTEDGDAVILHLQFSLEYSKGVTHGSRIQDNHSSWRTRKQQADLQSREHFQPAFIVLKVNKKSFC